jgi:uncharacterized membrane protein YdcZ (DUF606 family)
MSRPPARGRARRWLANVVWTVVGVLLYAVCIDVFGGYPRFHTEVLEWAGVVVLVLLGIAAWVWHQRHGDER